MGISHSWNGTVLTITSDSGTSSADLKGDMGVRGPQGAAGKITDINLSNYYTKEETETAINTAVSSIVIPEEPDLTPYALKIEVPSVEGLASEDYVDGAIANIVIPSTSGLASEAYVDNAINKIQIPSIEGLATEHYVNNAVAAIDIPSVEGLASEEYVDNAISALDIQCIDLVWKNASPSSSFAAQTVPFDNNGYIGIFVDYVATAGGSGFTASGFIPVANSQYLTTYITGSGTFQKRTCKVSASGIEFGVGQSGSSTSADSMIPVRIYGVKGVIAE